jgi:PAS domain S-box-containing protein
VPARASKKHRSVKRPRRARSPSLAERLREAEETLEAIRSGHVDALVVSGPHGEQVFTLRGADHRYRHLVETMNEGALLVSPDGLIVYSNARFATLLGTPLETLIGSSLATHAAEGSRKLVEALVAARGSAAVKAEVELVAADGAHLPVYMSATAASDDSMDLTSLVVTDLSAQKRDEAMLAAGRLNTLIVEHAAQGIVVCDRHGVIVRANQGVQVLVGGNPLLRSFEAALRFEGAPELARSIVERALAGHTLRGEEAAVRRAGGATDGATDGMIDDATDDAIHVLVSAAPITDGGGVILGCVVSFTDITEHKRAAAERSRLLDAAMAARIEAETANRAKDEFLAMLGHELRNPLAPILTALELMTLRGEERWPREREIIERHVRHVVALVGDLLDVSRITRGMIELQRRPIALATVIRDAIESVAPLIEDRRHALTCDVPGELWVDGDEGRLRQVFANLLTNAARYTPPGGAIEVAGAARDGAIVIAVRDNGAGIPPELLPSVFDMFVQGKRTIERSQGGLGLGLSIVRSLVELHGGSVRAASPGPGRGTAIEVSLPALRELPAGGEPRAIEPAVSAAGRRILIVDDNCDAADLLAEALAEAGFATRTAYDGPSALTAAGEFAPDVALLDIGLPVMDGYELARRLRDSERGRAMRLVAVTGYGQGADRMAARAAGFDEHFIKPIDLKALTSALRR